MVPLRPLEAMMLFQSVYGSYFVVCTQQLTSYWRCPGGGSPSSTDYDSVYGDYDGRKAIRVLNPCTNADDLSSSGCQWFDNPAVLSMQKQRWYATAEALADGTVVLIGGFVNGGYVNRNMPNTDPTYEGGAAEPTYEFYPSRGAAQVMQFMTTTSGLNSYAHTYLMPSGKMLVQANLSTSEVHFICSCHPIYLTDFVYHRSFVGL